MQPLFWINEPSILFQQKYISQIWPTTLMPKNEKLNAITRLIIILTILLYLITTNKRVIVAGSITLIAIIILKYSDTYSSTNKKVTFKDELEGFSNLNKEAESSLLQKPTQANPMMNVTLPQIQDDPQRPAASPAYNPKVVEEINTSTQDAVVNSFDNTKDIKEKLFSDLGDSFVFDRSMIQFHSTANTTIPNDQTSFAEFCYGDMISCKEGNAFACERNAPPNWING